MTDEQLPPAIQLVRDFVNTYEPQVDEESLTTPDELSGWLAEQRLVAAGTQLGDADLSTARAVREGFRNVLLSHAGHDPDLEEADAFRTVLADLPVRLDFGTHGYRLVSTRTDPAGRALGQLLDAVRQSSNDGTWLRLKVCARETCRWAFYDASRNQVRRWCSMAGCGNYVKMRRASASRKARADPTTGVEPTAGGDGPSHHPDNA